MPWRRFERSRALLCQRQAVDLDHVVEHAREHAHDFAVFVPVEMRLRGERVAHELGQVHRAEQAGPVGRQRLFAAGIGGADGFAPPVVVHLVDAVDQDEPGLGEVIRRDHDHVPQVPGTDVAIDLAGDQTVVARDVVVLGRPVAPDDLRRVAEVDLALFLDVDREHQRPVAVGGDRIHEFVGDQQAEVELAQASVLAFGANEVLHVRMRHVEGAHLGAAAATGRGHGEAHLVVDIHERHRTRCVRAGTSDEGPARAQRRKLVTDAATGFQRQSGLVHLFEDAVHRIGDRARDRAVDRAGRRLVFERTGIGRDASGRNRAATQRPQEALVPVLLLVGALLRLRQGAGNTFVGVVDGLVDGFTALALQAVFLVPDIERRRLQRNFRCFPGYSFKAHRTHSVVSSHKVSSTPPATTRIPPATVQKPAHRFSSKTDSATCDEAAAPCGAGGFNLMANPIGWVHEGSSPLDVVTQRMGTLRFVSEGVNTWKPAAHRASRCCDAEKNICAMLNPRRA
jgi:hypothetical protein